MAASTVEAIAQKQAEQQGKYDQFEKRFERMQVESDNTRRELFQAIKDLSNKMELGFEKITNTRRWQISCIITSTIAVCAIVGIAISLFN